jgi:hypothetical protein
MIAAMNPHHRGSWQGSRIGRADRYGPTAEPRLCRAAFALSLHGRFRCHVFASAILQLGLHLLSSKSYRPAGDCHVRAEPTPVTAGGPLASAPPNYPSSTSSQHRQPSSSPHKSDCTSVQILTGRTQPIQVDPGGNLHPVTVPSVPNHCMIPGTAFLVIQQCRHKPPGHVE